VRLGADIGLVCETCGRRVLLDRPTLEKRSKAVLERGPEVETASQDRATSSSTTAGIDVNVGTVLRAVRPVHVRVACYFTSAVEMSSGRLAADDLVKVTGLTGNVDEDVTVEPVEYAAFERSFVPGGHRSRETYTGYAIPIAWVVLAREFVPVEEMETKA
jgi:hypothetical protein